MNSLIGVSGKAGLEPCPGPITECERVTAVPQAASDWMLMPPAKQMWAVPNSQYSRKCSCWDFRVSGLALKVLVACGWAHVEESKISREG